MRTTISAALLAATALGLTACGGSSGEGDAAAAGDERDKARVQLSRCLREQGVQVPDGGGEGSGGPVVFRAGRVDRRKLDRAMQACEKYRKAAMPELSEEQQQEIRDSFARFSACMRRHGVEVPQPRVLGDGEPEEAPEPDPSFNADDPRVKEAHEACQDELPQPEGGGATPEVSP